MLDAITKNRIDAARDILVGKVPDPKSQVEQITIALIYKFMDDIDADSEELGGHRSFFAGEFARYGWAKLMRSGLGGQETLNLYAEAIARMPENPGIPTLFRNIFNNAFLPYRDPETLRAFLKIIDEFSYDHSERLGDAFEYLLSVLGSQGDAGQFRTPRHIIDFIVEILDPKKDEVILDPACGTAGFLISAYKHILTSNTDADGASTLTSVDHRRIAENLSGYDISPDMVRLSLVNMYLHKLTDPSVQEYDTLTSEERWNEYADVILANPPFMNPKGGIRPHSRFSIRARRSEVLFVDYIAEHLTPTGRAGVIVPEGIIFQSQNAHKQLRKMLVEDCLVAVVSLPAGVFKPYSGVKTSILILDKALARRTDSVAFIKVENDGYDLGDQRRPISDDDLPGVSDVLREHLRGISDESVATGEIRDEKAGYSAGPGPLVVSKTKIAEDGDYNLSGERYREVVTSNTQYDWSELGDVIMGKPQYGSGARKFPYDGKVRYVRITDINDDGQLKVDDVVSPSKIEPHLFLEEGDLLIARSGSVGRSYLHKNNAGGVYQYAGYLIRFRVDPTKAIPEYVYHITKSKVWWEWILSNSKTGTLTNINAKQYSSFSFPIPPVGVQKEIVAEIEGYQKVIDGARSVIENYRPQVAVDPEWPVVELGEVCSKVGSGSTPRGGKSAYQATGIPFIRSQNVLMNNFSKDGLAFVSEDIHQAMSGTEVQSNDVLLNITGASIGRVCVAPVDVCPANVNQHVSIVRADPSSLLPNYLALYMSSDEFQRYIMAIQVGGTRQAITKTQILKFRIPMPTMETQQTIVAGIKGEQVLVDANRELITRFERKIRSAIGRVWRE